MNTKKIKLVGGPKDGEILEVPELRPRFKFYGRVRPNSTHTIQPANISVLPEALPIHSYKIEQYVKYNKTITQYHYEGVE